MNINTTNYSSESYYYENNQYIDKSHIFLNNDTQELYIMFDGYFNCPIDNFKQILYKLKLDQNKNTPNEYFNFEHTLFFDYLDGGISDENSDNKIAKTNITNNSLYYFF